MPLIFSLSLSDEPCSKKNCGGYVGATRPSRPFHSSVFVGQQKGSETDENIRRNFGMPHPEGYRKAMRPAHVVWLNLEYLSAEAWVASRS